jgi:hypothetical protein
VYFQYANTQRADSTLQFISGLPVQSSRQLAQIDLYGPNPTTTSLLKSYVLGYQTAPISGRSRLASVRECDSATPPVCLTPTTFTYEDGSNEFKEYSYGIGGTETLDSLAPVTVADVNGDGKDDLVWRNPVTNPTTQGTADSGSLMKMGDVAAPCSRRRP